MTTPLPFHRVRSGFGLLEMLVVVAVTSMMVGGGIAAYRTFADKQALTNSAKELVVELRKTQKRAQSGEKPAGECDDRTLEGWYLERLSDTSYQVGVLCESARIGRERYDLSAGVEFENDFGMISFAVLTGRTQDRTIQLTGGGVLYEIEISAGGAISEKVTN